MKMLIVLLSFVLFVGTFAAQDYLAKRNVEKILGDVMYLTEDNVIVAALLKSTDRDCIIKKYKGYEDMLTEEADLVFFNIALTCSNKLAAVSGSLFDIIFSISGLINAFRKETSKKFFGELTCYNNYAVRKEYFDPPTAS